MSDVSLHSLPVVGCLWSICLWAQPSGLYCLLWKLLLATPAGTAHPLAQVKSATGFQFCFWLIPVLWMPFLASEHRLPEFVYWRIILKNKYSMFWLAFCLWILLCWQNNLTKTWTRRRRLPFVLQWECRAWCWADMRWSSLPSSTPWRSCPPRLRS